MRYWIVLLALGALLSGCQIVEPAPDREVEIVEIGSDAEPDVPPGRVAREVPFPEAEYAALERHDNASISGRLSLNGAVGSVAGVGVSVVPVTTYSAEAAEKALAGQIVEPADPRAQAFTRQTRTDGEGNFAVNGLPAGDYYVAATVVSPGGEPRFILNQVRVGNGQSVSVTLSR